jgi:hypothetical protein
MSPYRVHVSILGQVIFQVKHPAPILHKLLVLVKGVLEPFRVSWGFQGGGMLIIAIEEWERHIVVGDILIGGEFLSVS